MSMTLDTAIALAIFEWRLKGKGPCPMLINPQTIGSFFVQNVISFYNVVDHEILHFGMNFTGPNKEYSVSTGGIDGLVL